MGENVIITILKLTSNETVRHERNDATISIPSVERKNETFAKKQFLNRTYVPAATQ